MLLAESGLERAEQAVRTFEQETALGIPLNQEHGLTLGTEPKDPYFWYGNRGKELEAKNELLPNHRVAQDNLLLLLDLAPKAGQQVEELMICGCNSFLFRPSPTWDSSLRN